MPLPSHPFHDLKHDEYLGEYLRFYLYISIFPDLAFTACTYADVGFDVFPAGSPLESLQGHTPRRRIYLKPTRS